MHGVLSNSWSGNEEGGGRWHMVCSDHVMQRGHILAIVRDIGQDVLNKLTGVMQKIGKIVEAMGEAEIEEN